MAQGLYNHSTMALDDDDMDDMDDEEHLIHDEWPALRLPLTSDLLGATGDINPVQLNSMIWTWIDDFPFNLINSNCHEINSNIIDW